MINKAFKILWDLFIDGLVRIVYPFVFTFRYGRNVWKLYSSYHNSSSRVARYFKDKMWDVFMRKNNGGISINASIGLPIFLPHGVNGVFISKSAVIGSNAVIYQQVTIGVNTLRDSKTYGAPHIGDNVYIGSGAKVVGGVKIGNNCRIGANAVVVQDMDDNSVAVIDSMRIIKKDHVLNNKFEPFLS